MAMLSVSRKKKSKKWKKGVDFCARGSYNTVLRPPEGSGYGRSPERQPQKNRKKVLTNNTECDIINRLPHGNGEAQRTLKIEQ